MEKLQSWISKIKPLDQESMQAMAKRLDRLTKPPGSLGKLEALAVQLSGIVRSEKLDILRKAVVVMAADHGICDEGVSAYPQEVTGQMVLNFCNGGAAVNVLAGQAGADVFCVDIGVKANVAHPKLLVHKIRNGTRNMALEPAMEREEAEAAIEAGIKLVERLYAQGYRMFAAGEMGIGNTTASAALLCVLGNITVELAVGRGTGIDDGRLEQKKKAVNKAIEVNKPNRDDALDVLAKIGGLEIAGLAGVMIGSAAFGCPVIVDGFISTAAALVAVRLAPACALYMIASHVSNERGHERMLACTGLEPMLRLDMRLGEGTGAALCFPIIDSAIAITNEMATFDSAGVSEEVK